MKKILIAISFSFILKSGFCQQFITKGRIEFERKVNNYKQFEGEDNSWIEQIKKMVPQYTIDYFDFVFDGNRSIYKPGRESPTPRNAFMGTPPASENIVYNDYATNMFTSSKQVFENSYLLHDTMPAIKWKITSETRMIAGFNCRRAETILMDSVYIVAFYTDEIMATGGPEGFNGLPGMILGIAMPRTAITWFATKLELSTVKETDFKIPAKGKKATRASMKADIDGLVTRWGKYAHRFVWLVSI
jgi:GLPGLI family protein